MRPGLERLAREIPADLRRARVALLAGPASVDRRGESAVDVLARHKEIRLVRLLAAEHGLRGEHPAGEAVAHGTDAATGLPVTSLYGREWDQQALAGVDAVLVDLQDIGCRYYTYPGTMRSLILRVVRLGVPVWILDRPNPLGAAVAGPVGVEPGLGSLVGAFPVPVRHGRTIGELALVLAQEERLTAGAVRVLPVQGWQGEPFARWGRPWVPPSPNSSGPEMAELYPGMCLVEGTNLSEGRGTAYPFRQVGAPWLDGPALAAALRERLPRAVRARPVWFVPTASKHAGQVCQGVFFDLEPRVRREADAALDAAVLLLSLVCHHSEFRWLAHGGVHWVDRLSGSARLRRDLDAGEDLPTLLEDWRQQAQAFEKGSAPRLYPSGR